MKMLITLQSLLQLVELFKEHFQQNAVPKNKQNPLNLPLTGYSSKLSSFQEVSPTSHQRPSLGSFHADKIVSSYKLDAQLNYVSLALTNIAVRIL